MDKDILKMLTFDDVTSLKDLYRNYQNIAPHVYSFIMTTIKWKELEPSRNYFDFFAPYGKWKEDGCFISVGRFSWNIIILYTLDDSMTGCKKIYDALINTQRFEYSNSKYVYYAIYDKHIPIIEKAMAKLNMKKVKHEDINLWHFPQYVSSITSNYGIKFLQENYKCFPLTQKDVNTINLHWPHREVGSDKYVSTLIEMNGGYGIYSTSSEELVAWVTLTPLGTIGLLHVQENHRLKGLAMLLVNLLKEEIAAQGFPVSAIVLQENNSSRQMFAKIGFQNLMACACMTFK